MNKCRKMVLFSCFVMLIYSSIGWATSEKDDYQVEAEAQKDMLAYVQSTFPFRFGNDLQVGDYVQYEITDHHSEREKPELCSLEVTNRDGNVATIKEEFEGNILYYKIDIKSNTLQEYWGFDEDGIEQRPTLLSTQEAESRMRAMVGQELKPGISEMSTNRVIYVVQTLTQRESFTSGKLSLSCIAKAFDIRNFDDTTPDIRNALQEMTKALFSEAVPKMLPAKAMAIYLDNLEIFSGNTGLVKQRTHNLSENSKATRLEE